MRLPVRPFIRLSVSLSVSLSVRLLVYLTLYLCISVRPLYYVYASESIYFVACL